MQQRLPLLSWLTHVLLNHPFGWGVVGVFGSLLNKTKFLSEIKAHQDNAEVTNPSHYSNYFVNLAMITVSIPCIFIYMSVQFTSDLHAYEDSNYWHSRDKWQKFVLYFPCTICNPTNPRPFLSSVLARLSRETGKFVWNHTSKVRIIRLQSTWYSSDNLQSV